VRIVGILLAGGRGVRFGGAKLLAPLAADDAGWGTTVGVAACRRLMAACPEVIAVVRPDDGDLAAALRETGARVVACPRADEGMGASLACGVAAAADADGWVVALADMPWIAPATIAGIVAALGRGAAAAAPFHRGERGHPVGFGKACGPALAALTGDEGARRVVAAQGDRLVRIDVDDEGAVRDVDTPSDLRQGAGE
jgi:molybdenum cofactor cytidylyltransferase